jgi:hypothetical protein
VHGLLIRIFHAVDRALGLTGPGSYLEQYRGKYAIDTKIEALAVVAANYHLGILHLDDLQRVAEVSPKQSEIILNFLIQFANVVKVPLVISGTHKLARVLSASLEAARRAGSAGEEELALATSRNDPHFVLLTHALSRYQWLDEPVEFDLEWQKQIYKLSLALPGIEIPLIQSAQRVAHEAGCRQLKLEHLDQAYQRDFRLLHPALEALRSKNPDRFARYEDLLPMPQQQEMENESRYAFRTRMRKTR